MVAPPSALPAAGEPPAVAALTFEGVYEAHFPFVWRSARRLLGMAEGSVDDVVQEVFVVVHRRLGSFEGRSSVKTWLFGITLRVVRDHRRSQVRKSTREGDSRDAESVHADAAHAPDERAAKAEAVLALHRILEGLDDEKREVFVLAELEQMSAPEIADALQINLNTVYSRLRTARQAFEEGVARHRARDERTARTGRVPGQTESEGVK